MKTLFLLRHAHALDGYNDQQRPLSPLGEMAAQKVAKAFIGKKIDAIVCSSALRTLQTAQIIAQSIGFDAQKIISQDELYNTEMEVLRDYIAYFPQTYQNVLFVNHNPAISFLAKFLVGNSVGFFSPAGWAQIELETWDKLTKHSAKLKNIQNEDF